MHVCKHAHNLHLKIYDTHKMCKQMIFEYCLNISIFFHFSIPLVYCLFYSNLFFQKHQKYFPLKCIWFVHSHKKKYSLETCMQLLCMLLQDLFTIARPHRKYNTFFTKECSRLFVLPKIK